MEQVSRFWEIDVQKEPGKWALMRFAHLYRRALELSKQEQATKDAGARALIYALYSCYLDCQTEGLSGEAKRVIELAEREHAVET